MKRRLKSIRRKRQRKESEMNTRKVKYFASAVFGFAIATFGFAIATIICCSRPVSAIGGEWALPILSVGVLAFRDMLKVPR